MTNLIPHHRCRHCGFTEYGFKTGSVLDHKPDCLLRREAEWSIKAAEARGRRKRERRST